MGVVFLLAVVGPLRRQLGMRHRGDIVRSKGVFLGEKHCRGYSHASWLLGLLRLLTRLLPSCSHASQSMMPRGDQPRESNRVTLMVGCPSPMVRGWKGCFNSARGARRKKLKPPSQDGSCVWSEFHIGLPQPPHLEAPRTLWSALHKL